MCREARDESKDQRSGSVCGMYGSFGAIAFNAMEWRSVELAWFGEAGGEAEVDLFRIFGGVSAVTDAGRRRRREALAMSRC